MLIAFPWIWFRGLQNPDELRYASIVLEMIARSDYFAPHLNNVPYFEKPPLLYWLGVCFVKIFGDHLGTYRLSSILSGLGIVILACKIGKSFGGDRIALYSGMIAATSTFSFVFSQGFTPDSMTGLWISTSVWFGIKYVDNSKDALNTRKDLYYFFGSCALGVLTKGLIGILLPILIIGAYLITQSSFKSILNLIDPKGFCLFFILVAPWHLYMELNFSGFSEFYFFKEHFLRYTTNVHGREKPYWYLPAILLAGTFPWSLFVAPAFFTREHRLPHNTNVKIHLQKMRVWATIVFIFFWFSKSQLPGYLTPIIVPVSVLVASYFYSFSKKTACKAISASCALIISTCAAIVLNSSFFNADVDFLNQLSGWQMGGVAFTLTILIVGFCWQLYTSCHGPLPVAFGTIPFYMLAGYLLATFEPKSLRPLFTSNPELFSGRQIAVYRTYLLDSIYYLKKPAIFVDRPSELDYNNKLYNANNTFIDLKAFNDQINNGVPFVVIGRVAELKRFQHSICTPAKDDYIICAVN